MFKKTNAASELRSTADPIREKSYKEGIANDPRRLAISYRDTRTLRDVENRAKAPSVTDTTEIKVGEINRPRRASERKRDG